MCQKINQDISRKYDCNIININFLWEKVNEEFFKTFFETIIKIDFINKMNIFLAAVNSEEQQKVRAFLTSIDAYSIAWSTRKINHQKVYAFFNSFTAIETIAEMYAFQNH